MISTSSGLRLRFAAGINQDARQRLAHFQAGCISGAQSQAGNLARQGHLLEQGFIDTGWSASWPGGMVNAGVRIRTNGAHQVLVHRLGHERDKGRQQLAELDQDVVQGGVGRIFIAVVLGFPEAPPAAAHVPVAQIIQQGFDRQGGVEWVGIFQGFGHPG